MPIKLKFPCDFEEKLKLPTAPNGSGYPYRIGAKDLMDNYRTAALMADETKIAGGLYLKEYQSDGQRFVHIAGTIQDSGTGLPGDSLPDGSNGDLLMHNGSSWGPLTGYEVKRVFLCESGTPVEYDILAKPV